MIGIAVINDGCRSSRAQGAQVLVRPGQLPVPTSPTYRPSVLFCTELESTSVRFVLETVRSVRAHVAADELTVSELAARAVAGKQQRQRGDSVGVSRGASRRSAVLTGSC